MRVILVDDEQELVIALAERLEFRGIDAQWADNGEDALKMVTENDYDLAILDVKLPKTSGLELKKKMQKIAPALKYIFVTGHGSQQDYKTGSAEAGCEYYLIKPVKIEVLVEKMKDALGQ
jgi:DNA-binding response OmpR family regulator